MSILLSALLLAGTSGAPNMCTDASPTPVPLADLIKAPQKWSGRFVEVIGYAHFQYEGDALFLHKRDIGVYRAKHAVALEIQYGTDGRPLDSRLQLDALEGRPVKVRGIFASVDSGAMYLSTIRTGAIYEICSITNEV